MKASKYMVYVCWGMIAISFVVVWLLRCEIDIHIQEQITKTAWAYDCEIRDFYTGIWGNILTGAIVSLITSYVSYGQAKHQIEFSLLSNEKLMCMYYKSILCGLYTKSTMNIHNNVCRFRKDFSKLGNCYNAMIVAHNDYSPFIKTKKVKTLFSAKVKLQEIWLNIVVYQDDLYILSDEQEIQKIIAKLQLDVLKSKEAIETQSSNLKSISK